MLGFVYSCPNKYILSRLLKQIKAQKINYSIYDEYIVVEKKLKGDFSRVTLLATKGDKAGKPVLVKIKKWKNNEIIYETEKIKSIIRYKFSLTYSYKYFYLNTGIKKYKFKKINSIYEEYFRKKKKIYFEKRWEEQPIYGDIVSMDKFKKFYNFNFDSFYDNFYKKLTKNKQIIIALFILNIAEVDIAKLMEVSQPYISLEIKRICESIKKKININNIAILNVE